MKAEYITPNDSFIFYDKGIIYDIDSERFEDETAGDQPSRDLFYFPTEKKIKDFVMEGKKIL